MDPTINLILTLILCILAMIILVFLGFIREVIYRLGVVLVVITIILLIIGLWVNNMPLIICSLILIGISGLILIYISDGF
jgi:hypothetical protein